MIIWTENTDPLIDVSMTDYPVTAEISATAAEPPEPPTPPALPPFITDIQADVDPLLVGLVLVTSEIVDGAGTITVHAPDWNGTFPPDGLDYLLDGQLQTVVDWADLPAAAEQIIAFRPHPQPVYEYNLIATATLDDGTGELSEHRQTYIIRLTADYTPGRDTLLEEIDARRRA